MKSYFPIMIRITKTGDAQMIKNPNDLPVGEAFVIIGTNTVEAEKTVPGKMVDIKIVDDTHYNNKLD